MNVSVFFQVLGTFAAMVLAVAGVVGLGVWIEKHIGLWQSIAIVVGAIAAGFSALVACLPGVH
jgi:hypothetical protein